MTLGEFVTLKVTYPEMMKMEMTSIFEIDNPKTISLGQLRAKIFTGVWEMYDAKTNTVNKRHGELHEIVLKEGEDLIETDDDLHECLKSSFCAITAVFQKQVVKQN